MSGHAKPMASRAGFSMGLRGVVVLLVAAIAVLACSVDVRVGDLTEERYRQVWRDRVGALVGAMRPFSTGICNVGGDQHQCHEASAEVVVAIDTFLGALNEVEVPPQFMEGHTATRAALVEWREGLLQGNRAFELQDDEDFRAGNTKIGTAIRALVAAYDRFPKGSRPEPAIGF
jgi:hypothetical protein